MPLFKINPDVIVVDETVNGVYGEELCSKVKADKAIANIPVILLIKSADNESYLSHVGSKADRLELRSAEYLEIPDGHYYAYR